MQRQERCDKWWIVEWDTFARVSVRDYYRKVWDYPFVASSVRLTYREPEWSWFSHVSIRPEIYSAFLVGAVPFLYLISDDVIKHTCRTLLEAPITGGNGELRFPTAANKCGFPPCGYSPPMDRITWIQWHSMPEERTIFHPVKKIFPVDQLCLSELKNAFLPPQSPGQSGSDHRDPVRSDGVQMVSKCGRHFRLGKKCILQTFLLFVRKRLSNDKRALNDSIVFYWHAPDT